jgi:hypothetical protein
MKQLGWGLMLVVAGALAGCPDTGRSAGGGSPSPALSTAPVAEQMGQTKSEEPPPVDFNQLTLRWSDRLGSAQRAFGEVYARSTWVHLDLVAGDWDQARTAVTDLRAKLTGLPEEPEVPRDVRALVSALPPLVSELADEVDRHDQTAVLSAKKLVIAMNRLVGDPAIVAWLNQPPAGSPGAVASEEPLSPEATGPMAVPTSQTAPSP